MLTRILIVLALVAGSVAAAVPAHAAGEMQVFVTTPTNTVFTLDVDSSDSIENVRQRIQDITAAPPAQQVLFLGTTRLEDGRTVADYPIGQGSAIRLVYLPSTGVGMQVFVSDPVGGATITLDVLASDSVENVKTRIQDKLGYSPLIQRISYRGTVMVDGYTLTDYNVQQESTLGLAIVTGGSGYQIVVAVASSGQTVLIDVESSDSIENVKTKIQDRLGVQPDSQRLYFGGALLADDRTLADYNVQQNNVVTLAQRVTLSWTDAALAPFIASVDYSDSVSAARQFAPPTYAVTAGALPAGITLDPTGTLAGRATALGAYSFTITATRDDGLTIDQAFSGSVAAAAVASTLAATGDDSILPIGLAAFALLLGVALRVRRRA